MRKASDVTECGRARDLTRKELLGLALGGVSFAALLSILRFEGHGLGGMAGTARAAEVARPTVLDATSTSTRIVEIAAGVFVHQGQLGVYSPANGGDICNTGFIIGRDAVAVIDTGGTAHLGAAMKAKIESLTNRPIRYVINTHMHPDHVLGNAAFRSEGTQFVGHHKLGPALAARAERYLAFNREAVGTEAFAGTEIVLPTMMVVDRLEIDLGGRKLLLNARPTAHTDNDLTVRDATTDTAFLGDLIFAGHVPTLDGSIRGWLALLAALETETAGRIVPGHGPASMDWPGAAAPVRRYLTAIADGVRQAIRDGRTLREAIETVGNEERDNWLLFDEFHRRNVSAAFAELEWE